MFKWITGILLSALLLATPGCVVSTRRGGWKFGIDVRVVTYAHGHAHHICGTGCVYYASPIVTWPHGHHRHHCRTTCSFYVWPHGHYRHHCHRGCHRFRLKVYIHGHHLHVCRLGCRH